MTMLSSRPALVSAMTLKVVRSSTIFCRSNFTVTGPFAILASQPWPSAWVTPVIGA